MALDDESKLKGEIIGECEKALSGILQDLTYDNFPDSPKNGCLEDRIRTKSLKALHLIAQMKEEK